MRWLVNTDPFCLSRDSCRATGDGLCRRCAKACGKYSAASKAALADPAVRAKMSAASKAALADPAVRAKMSAARKAALADPAVRAKMEKEFGWLSPDERASVVAELRAGKSYADVAYDWLLSYGRVAQIAREEGIRRRPTPFAKAKGQTP